MSSTSSTSRAVGARKAALLIASLDRAAQAQILKSLDARALAGVTEAMRELGRTIQPGEVDALYAELARALHGPVATRPPLEDEMRALLEAALGKEKAKSVVDGIEDRRRHERPFEAIATRHGAAFARVLARESPAVIALVLAHTPPERSAELLAALDTDRALEVVRRMARLESPTPRALEIVARELESRAAAEIAPAPSGTPEKRIDRIAQMLARAPAGVDRTVLTGLDAADQDTANEIRERMFSWEDLAGLDKRGMQKVLSSIETRSLAIALKGSSKAVEEAVLVNLSQRVRAMVADERDIAGPTPRAEVEGARKEVLKAVRDLMESGQLAASKDGEEMLK